VPPLPVLKLVHGRGRLSTALLEHVKHLTS
jgi:hypothetical protein